MSDGTTTMMIESYLDKIEAGDSGAIDELIGCAFKRLIQLCERIVGRMINTKADVRVSDVFQEAYFRLKNALAKDNVNPKSSGEFMNLAARHIRFQVLDMLRQAKKDKPLSGESGTIIDIIDSQLPDDIEMWIRFYEAFEELPEEERQVADLLWTWVEGKGSKAVPNLTQYEAAIVLGFSRDKVKDLWRNAKIKIARKCKEFSPFTE